ncbi:DNA gyrase/topoisomerase IV subunit A [Arthrobacter ulcerisalmonis]|nr:DNA gyrase/topoisomerase IV subunit A [Arthrobacter ulcerisalmonis]
MQERGMDEDERHTRDELATLEALLQALERRDEVFQVVDDSENVDEAIRRVGELLGIGAVASRAVIDLQVRRFTLSQRRTMASRAGELRSMLLDGH